jgi:hypothetical protein
MVKPGETTKQPTRSDDEKTKKEPPKPPLKKRPRPVSQAAVEAIPKR